MGQILVKYDEMMFHPKCHERRKSMQVTPEERVKTEVIYGLILG
jgi:hypothetical protein